MTGWQISAPQLSDDEADQAVAAGGLSGGADPGNTAVGILAGLQRIPVYGGTVDPNVKADRRRRNKLARKARRNNRRAS